MAYLVHTNGKQNTNQETLAPVQMQANRLEYCTNKNLCGLGRSGNCLLCGCNVKDKVKYLNNQCPRNLW